MRPPRHLSLLTSAAVVLLALGLAACSHKAAGDEDKKAEGASVVADVTLVRVTRADISRMLAVTGSIAAPPNQDVRVSSLVPGRVAEMKVAEGDHVRAGQIVAEIDARPFRDQLRQAEAAAATARANLENAKLSRARNENLFERGITARKELEDARTLQSVAEAALQQAEATLALARLQLARTEVQSPINGVVVKRFVSVGEQVDGTAAQPIVEVANLGEVELLGNVAAAFLGKFRPGQSVSFASDAFPGRTFTGRVVAVSPAVDPVTATGLVRIRISNGAGSLRLGMFLNAQVAIETHAKALTVPPQAIYRDEEGKAHVYLVQGDIATATDVELGIETPDRVELLSGVSEGAAVILTGGYGLGDKAKIKVQGQAKP